MECYPVSKHVEWISSINQKATIPAGGILSLYRKSCFANLSIRIFIKVNLYYGKVKIVSLFMAPFIQYIINYHIDML